MTRPRIALTPSIEVKRRGPGRDNWMIAQTCPAALHSQQSSRRIRIGMSTARGRAHSPSSLYKSSQVLACIRVHTVPRLLARVALIALFALHPAPLAAVSVLQRRLRTREFPVSPNLAVGLVIGSRIDKSYRAQGGLVSCVCLACKSETASPYPRPRIALRKK